MKKTTSNLFILPYFLWIFLFVLAPVVNEGGLAMKRAIHPIKADMMRLHRIFPAKFGLALNDHLSIVFQR